MRCEEGAELSGILNALYEMHLMVLSVQAMGEMD
jgi:hypothetical protein